MGPPGSGKTLLARTIPTLLPPLGDAEALAATIVASVSGERPVSGAGPAAAVPSTAPHGLVRRDRRWRAGPRTRRGDPGGPRSPVSRRAAGVQPRRPRGAPPAARGGPDRDRPGGADRGPPGSVPVRGRDEPVPLRSHRERHPVRVPDRRAGALCRPDLGAAPRPDRPVGWPAEAPRGRPDRRRGARGFGDGRVADREGPATCRRLGRRTP